MFATEKYIVSIANLYWLERSHLSNAREVDDVAYDLAARDIIADPTLSDSERVLHLASWALGRHPDEEFSQTEPPSTRETRRVLQLMKDGSMLPRWCAGIIGVAIAQLQVRLRVSDFIE